MINKDIRSAILSQFANIMNFITAITKFYKIWFIEKLINVNNTGCDKFLFSWLPIQTSFQGIKLFAQTYQNNKTVCVIKTKLKSQNMLMVWN